MQRLWIMTDILINESHMTMLQDELAQLRDDMQDGQTDVSRIQALCRMTEKMTENAAGGQFEKQLLLIQGLLRAVAENTQYQVIIKKYSAALDRLSQ